MEETIKCLIIGSGPAGYTAAIYTSRANLRPVLYEGIEPGGQLTTTTDVENFPGYPDGVSGQQMMADMRRQAERFGAYIIVRKPHLRASKAMQERVFNTTNIEVMFNHNTAEVLGDESGVTGALLRCNDGKEVRIDIAGFFLAIGHHPNTELFADQLTLDAEGYIKTEAGTSKTNIEGVFAAGDVRDPHYRQAITAAASGCIAAIDCERFILSRAE